ncbi:hypothetical protein DES53_115118 [Roseimicrobium gellanilyticum]|uniref:Uncharacterized protein n=1 Tax=Roseimicrobium gellanilyticum TaxID=748857 RepID=A0A366H6E5_9BACT|nr:hypothetical protein [Roseimicrobium gellanilyticum]RBP36977.1 hypothetical protein DES53_115118 [Roseimicrobium gellanilyticum]
MSPRLRVLVFVVFLILLAIPVVYVAVTWSPENPLRFRAVLVEGSTAPVGWRNLEIYVENVSPAPIHLLEYTVGTSYTYSIPLGYKPRGPFDSTHSQARFIPAGGEVRTWHFIREADLKEENGRYWMQYACYTSTKMRGLKVLGWVHAHSPQWLRGYFPTQHLYYDSVPMSVPSRE